MRLLLVPALMLIAALFVPGHTAAEPADVATAVDRWESVPLPDVVEDPPLAFAWSRSDPRVVYGRAQRTLWRSEDGGRSWTATGFMGDEESPWWQAPFWGPIWGRAVAVDAGDPRTVYVRSTALATSPKGGWPSHDVWSRVRSAAYVSRDGGETWQDLNCLHVAPDPVRPGRVYGVSANLRLQMSEDRGRTWRDLDFGHPQLVNGLYVYTGPADPDRILVGQQPAALWRSTDGGATWTHTTLGRGFDQLAMDERIPGRLYGVAGRGVYGVQDSLFVSDDGGAWRLLHVFGADAAAKCIRCTRLVPHPDEGRLAAVSDARFWIGDDGGATWQAHDAPSGITAAAFDPADPDRLLLAAKAYPEWGYLFESRDGGSSWSPMAAPELPPPVGTVTAGPGGRLWAGSATEPDDNSRLAALYVRDGDVWQRRGSTPRLRGCDGPVRSLFIHPQDSQVVLADFGSVLRSDDGGHSWQQTQAYREAFAQGPSPFHTRADRPTTIYFHGEGLWRSDDTGGSWQSLENPTGCQLNCPYPVGFVPSLREPGAVLLGYDSDRLLCRRVDAEHDSGHVVATVPDDGYLVAMARHPLSQQLIVAAAVDNGVAVYSVEEDGLRWRQLGGCEGIFPVTYNSVRGLGRHDDLSGWRCCSHGIARLRFHPTDPDIFYLVFRRDLLVTRDGGQTWQRIEDPPRSVPWYNDVAVDPEAPDDLYVATPHGLYRLRGAVGTAVSENRDARPGAFCLRPAYPNPFNSATVIPFTLPEDGHVVLRLHNLAGQRVRTLIHGVRQAGSHAAHWDGRDDEGRTLATGVYLYRLVVDGRPQQTRRMLLLR